MMIKISYQNIMFTVYNWKKRKKKPHELHLWNFIANQGNKIFNDNNNNSNNDDDAEKELVKNLEKEFRKRHLQESHIHSFHLF